MTRIDEVQSTVMDWMNRQQKAVRKPIAGFDWHDYVPTGKQLRAVLPIRQTRHTAHVHPGSLLIGLAVGVGIGVGVGLMASRPSLNRAKRQVKQAIEAAEENLQNLPSRLNITRMEETQTKR